MENWCANLCGVLKKQKQKEKPGKDWPEKINNNKTNKLVVLKEPTGQEIGLRLGRELGRGEFGITYLCKDRQTGEELACKSISKNKLRTAIDIEDVRREVEIMKHLPKHPNIVSLKYTYEDDDDDVHLVMELCQGGHLLDHIIGRGYYTEHSAASIIKTIVEIIQICHKHGVMHRNVKLENFLFADKKETTPLKVTGFRSSIFFQPETEQGVVQEITRSVIDFNRAPWPKVFVSVNAQDLVTKMLDPDPKRRLTAQEVLDHPWFNLVKKEPDTAKDLLKKMLATHEVLGHPLLQNPNTTPNVSLVETVRGKLLQFSAMNHLIKTTSRVIAEHLYDEEFWVRDTGIKGHSNHDELRRRLYSLGQQNPNVDVQRLVDAFDGDRDGCYLDYGMFLDISDHLRMRSHEEHIDRAFRYFDNKQSGYIEHEELRKVSLKTGFDEMSEKVIYAIMHDVARNKDGRISYEEITNWSFRPQTMRVRRQTPVHNVPVSNL